MSHAALKLPPAPAPAPAPSRNRKHKDHTPPKGTVKTPSRALLIGINYVAWPRSHLEGPWNDIETSRKYLVNILRMNPKNIRILSDQGMTPHDKTKKIPYPLAGKLLWPTKENILDGFNWLTEGAKAGDVLYLHYSGHGIQLDPFYSDVITRKSSKAICPIDVLHKDYKDIYDPEMWNKDKFEIEHAVTGQEFYNAFHTLDPMVNLTAIYDCCHSTGIMRDLDDPTRKVKGINPKTARPTGTATVTDKIRTEPIYGRVHANEELYPPYVNGFAAAQGWEVATESEGKGLFTAALFKVLELENWNVKSNETIIELTRKELLNKNQTPMITMSPLRARYPFLVDLTTINPADYPPLPEKPNPPPQQPAGGAAKKPAAGSVAKSRNVDRYRDRDIDRDMDRDMDRDIDRDMDRDVDRDMDRDIEGTREATEQVRNVVNVYTQIASSSELQKLREQERGLFDTLLQHAVPFALKAAQTAISTIGRKRDVGVEDMAVQRHLPTALNLAHQIYTIPEVQADRGLFDKIFSIGMPLVLNTAQTLFGAKRGLGAADDDAQRGFFDSIIGNLPGTVFNVLSNVISKRDIGDDRDFGNENRDIGEGERGFLDILKKFAPIVLNVAGSAVQSLQGQRSLAFAPTGRGFFDTIKNVVKKVINLPIIKTITYAIHSGVNMIKDVFSIKRAIGEAAPSNESAESHVRGFFGSMLQSLAPIAMGALQGAMNSGRRDIDGGRNLVVIPQERGIFDIVAHHLPYVIQMAQQNFARQRALGATNESESQYLQKVISDSVPSLILAAQKQIATPTVHAERGLVTDIIKTIF